MLFDVLFSMYLRLLKKPATAAELAERFEVSARTVFRYAEILSSAGVPIISKRGYKGGIAIAEEYRIGALHFTKEERAEVLTALGNVNRLLGKSGALEKFGVLCERADKDEIRGGGLIIDGLGWGNTGSQARKIGIFSAAREKNLVTEFTYTADGTAARRAAEPHALVYKEGNWYLYAYCRLRKAFRLFRLSRVSDIMTKAEVFERKETDLDSAPWNESIKEKAKLITIKLEFCGEARSALEDWLGEDALRGNCAEAEVFYSEILKVRLLSFGALVRIIEPDYLIDEVRKTAVSVAAMYERAPSST